MRGLEVYVLSSVWLLSEDRRDRVALRFHSRSARVQRRGRRGRMEAGLLSISSVIGFMDFAATAEGETKAISER